jgi:hypothetical protein
MHWAICQPIVCTTGSPKIKSIGDHAGLFRKLYKNRKSQWSCVPEWKPLGSTVPVTFMRIDAETKAVQALTTIVI